MTTTGLTIYIALLVGLGLIAGVVILLRQFGGNFFQQSVAMLATIGTHAERFLRRGATTAAQRRADVRKELEEVASNRKGIILLGLMTFPVWLLVVRTARRLDAQLLHAVFENAALANGISFVLVAFTSLAGFIVVELISPVKLPFFNASTPRGRAGLAAALLVLVPVIATIQINLASDRAETIRTSAIASVSADSRTLTEVLKSTTAPDERAVLESRLGALSDKREVINANAERQRRNGITGALTAAAVEAITSFSLPIAFLVALVAGLWLIDGILGFAAGAIALATLLVRALPGLFRRARPAAAAGLGLPVGPGTAAGAGEPGGPALPVASAAVPAGTGPAGTPAAGAAQGTSAHAPGPARSAQAAGPVAERPTADSASPSSPAEPTASSNTGSTAPPVNTTRPPTRRAAF